MAGGKFWSVEDIEFLRKNYDAMTKDQLALVLGRTKIAIGIMATKIGVKKSPEAFSKAISETRKRHKFEIESLRQQLASQGEALAAALAACKGKDDELEQLRSPLNMYKLCGD